MQKDLSNTAEALAEGMNELYKTTKANNLILLVKKQAEEIDRRGQTLLKLEEILRFQQENLLKLEQQNKHLEAMLQALKEERVKLLEETEGVSAKQAPQEKQKVTRQRKKLEKQEEDVDEAA